MVIALNYNHPSDQNIRLFPFTPHLLSLYTNTSTITPYAMIIMKPPSEFSHSDSTPDRSKERASHEIDEDSDHESDRNSDKNIAKNPEKKTDQEFALEFRADSELQTNREKKSKRLREIVHKKDDPLEDFESDFSFDDIPDTPRVTITYSKEWLAIAQADFDAREVEKKHLYEPKTDLNTSFKKRWLDDPFSDTKETFDIQTRVFARDKKECNSRYKIEENHDVNIFEVINHDLDHVDKVVLRDQITNEEKEDNPLIWDENSPEYNRIKDLYSIGTGFYYWKRMNREDAESIKNLRLITGQLSATNEEQLKIQLKNWVGNKYETLEGIPDYVLTFINEDPEMAAILLGGNKRVKEMISKDCFPDSQKELFNCLKHLTKDAIKKLIPEEYTVIKSGARHYVEFSKEIATLLDDKVPKVSHAAYEQILVQAYQLQSSSNVVYDMFMDHKRITKKFKNFNENRKTKWVLPELLILADNGFHIIPDGNVWGKEFCSALNFEVILRDIPELIQPRVQQKIESVITNWFSKVLPEIHQFHEVNQGYTPYYYARLIGDSKASSLYGHVYSKTLRAHVLQGLNELREEKIMLNFNQMVSIDKFWGNYLPFRKERGIIKYRWGSSYTPKPGFYYDYKRMDAMPLEYLKGRDGFQDLNLLKFIYSSGLESWCTNLSYHVLGNYRSDTLMSPEYLSGPIGKLFDLSGKQIGLLNQIFFDNFSENPFNLISSDDKSLLIVRLLNEVNRKNEQFLLDLHAKLYPDSKIPPKNSLISLTELILDNSYSKIFDFSVMSSHWDSQIKPYRNLEDIIEEDMRFKFSQEYSLRNSYLEEFGINTVQVSIPIKTPGMYEARVANIHLYFNEDDQLIGRLPNGRMVHISGETGFGAYPINKLFDGASKWVAEGHNFHSIPRVHDHIKIDSSKGIYPDLTLIKRFMDDTVHFLVECVEVMDKLDFKATDKNSKFPNRDGYIILKNIDSVAEMTKGVLNIGVSENGLNLYHEAALMSLSHRERFLMHFIPRLPADEYRIMRTLQNPLPVSLSEFLSIKEGYNSDNYLEYCQKLNKFADSVKKFNPQQFQEHLQSIMGDFIKFYSAFEILSPKEIAFLQLQTRSLQRNLGVNPDNPSQQIWSYQDKFYEPTDFETKLHFAWYGLGSYSYYTIRIRDDAIPKLKTVYKDRRLGIAIQNPHLPLNKHTINNWDLLTPNQQGIFKNLQIQSAVYQNRLARDFNKKYSNELEKKNNYFYETWDLYWKIGKDLQKFEALTSFDPLVGFKPVTLEELIQFIKVH